MGAQESYTGETAVLSEETMSTITKRYEGAKLKDGTYEGEATGYKPGLTVSVTIKDNVISSIKITDHNEENSRYYAKAMDTVPGEIIDNQSLDVDAVTGATFTSIGIINAVNDALLKAVISGELPEQQQLPANHKAKRR